MYSSFLLDFPLRPPLLFPFNLSFGLKALALSGSEMYLDSRVKLVGMSFGFSNCLVSQVLGYGVHDDRRVRYLRVLQKFHHGHSCCIMLVLPHQLYAHFKHNFVEGMSVNLHPPKQRGTRTASIPCSFQYACATSLLSLGVLFDFFLLLLSPFFFFYWQ